MKKMKSITSLLFLLATAFLLSAVQTRAEAQEVLWQKKDSIVHGVDTIATATTGGTYVTGAFTLYNSTTEDTLRPQVRYYGSSEWVTTSVKNLRTLSSDTVIISKASSWPQDYAINDPVIVGFRLVKTGVYAASRKVYVWFRFRREF